MLKDSESGSSVVVTDPAVAGPPKVARSVCDVVGFYSVIQVDSIGYCGGLLVLNRIGRPIEFHCTLPVKPENAQTILYGQSLEPFLYAEHIGPPLIQKAKSDPALILVNQVAAIGLHAKVKSPVALIQSARENRVSWKAANQADSGLIDDWLQQISLDLNEPFERIEAAINEAHSVGR